MAGKAGKTGARSHTGVRRIKHWVKLDDETARQLMEIVAIERAWGRQTDDQCVPWDSSVLFAEQSVIVACAHWSYGSPLVCALSTGYLAARLIPNQLNVQEFGNCQRLRRSHT